MKRLLLILLVMLWPTLAQATVLLTEDYEVADMAALYTLHGWTLVCGGPSGGQFTGTNPPPGNSCTTSLSTTRVHGGTKALRQDYLAGQDSLSGFEDYYASKIGHSLGSLTEVYGRYWAYYEKANAALSVSFMTQNGGTSKQHYFNPGGSSSIFAILSYVFTALGYDSPGYYIGVSNSVQNLICPDGQSKVACDTDPNVNPHLSTPFNQWVCWEYHIKLNTVDQRDGVLQTWLNGQPILNYINVNWRNTGATATGVLNELQIFRQGATNMYRYEDDFALGTTRFNDCPGGVVDTTPPTQVTGVTVTGTTNTTASVTIAGATDNVGVTNYRYELCAGVGCTTFALWATTGTGLTTSLTGLTANTSYNLRVNAQDGSGNLGAYSTTVPLTTTNTADITRVTLGTDDFNRANGGLGASYTQTNGGNTIVSGAVQAITLDVEGIDTRTDVLADDQWLELTLGSWTGTEGVSVILRPRFGTPDDIACLAQRNQSNGQTAWLYHGGVLATRGDITWATGDRARCEIQGSTLRFYRNDTLLLSETAATVSGGKVGFEIFLAASGALTDATIEAISWGEWGVVAAPVIVNAVTDATGSQLTYGTTTPSFVRVQTDTTNVVYDISAITAGRFNQPGGGWAFGLTFVCFFAQDATHTESGIEADHQCDSLVGLTLPGDTTPPVLSSPAPSGTLAEGTTSTVISIISDELADLKYSTTDVAYGSMASSMTTVDGLHHSATVSGLTSGGAYTYYVRGQDRSVSLNVNTTSTVIAFLVAAPSDTTPPVLSGGSPTGTLAAGTTSVSMVVQTNENATCKYSATAGVTYAAMATTFTTGNGTMAHSTTVGSLTNGTTYTRYVKCVDGAANANTSDYAITWTIANPVPDVTPPILSGGSPSGQLPAGTTSVIMQVNTNETATCKYNTVAGRAYTHPSSITFTSTNSTAHSTTITGLANSTTYTRYIRCRDTTGNVNGTDYVVTWSIATPVAPDTTPPVRSGGSPSGALPSGTTAVSLQVTTDETSTCKYGTVIATAYASIANTFTTTGGTAHSQTIGSLSDGVTYTYYVRCADVLGNANSTDYTITWSVTAAADATPPIRSGGSPNGVALPAGTTSVSMQLSTNETATCKYGTVASTAYASIANTFAVTNGTAHSQTIATSNGVTYTYYVRCLDVATNPNTDDYAITWSVTSLPPDVSPPNLSAGAPSGTLPTTTTSVTLTVTSSEAATCKYGTVIGTAYASIANTFTTTGGTTHTQTLSVAANTTYTEYVRCQDGAGNANLSDYVITWFVAAAPDVTPATLTNGAPTGTLPAFTTDVTLQVTTSEAATCKYGTIAATAYAGIANTFSTTGGTAHVQALGGLSAGTYTEYVRCSDASGNANLVDYVITWAIDADPDSTPPLRSVGFPSGVQAIGTTSVLMSLVTDEDATCKYGTTAGVAYASIASTFGTTGAKAHSQTISSLTDGQLSTYYIRCIDGTGNANTTDFLITWSVAADVTAPIRSAGLPSGVQVSGTTSVSMQLTTDENATCKYGIIPGTAYSAIAHTFSTTGSTGQSQTIGSLIDGQVSTYFIRCRDAALNANLDDYVITWSVAVTNDSTAPTAPTNLTCTTFSSSQAFCAFTAGTDAVGIVGNEATIGIDSGGTCTPSIIIDPFWGTSSPQPLVNLSGGATYCVTMKSFDAAGNRSPASNTSTFVSTTVVDPIPPSNVVQFEPILGGTLYNTVGLTWQPGTDNVFVTRTDIYRCAGDGCTDFNVKFSTPQTGFMDTTVAPNTIYRYKAYHVDGAGNVSVSPSTIIRVVTPLSTVGATQGLCPCKPKR